MKAFPRALAVLLPLWLMSIAAAQVQPGMFKHIIIVVQENRTPDNLFGAHAMSTNCGTLGDFPGADIVSTNVGNGSSFPCNVATPMLYGVDPNHQNADWLNDWDSGLMDGFCDGGTPPCAAYSFVRVQDMSPYLSIATTYGFANYMFQTNEGPSLEAHQFLFAGTSAPVAFNTSNDYYWYFVKDNPGTATNSGCPVNTDLTWIDPLRNTLSNPPLSYECYPHDSLVTGAANCASGVCDKGISWRYYAPTSGSIWDAPEAIPEVCYGVNDTTHAGTACGTINTGNTTEWNQHMSFSTSMNNAPIFTDISNCQLQQISWVIPDDAWSDHPNGSGFGAPLGPTWVADIVNAIGNTSTGTGNCNYWGNGTNTNHVEPTAILIVWDDWGGFYDHVAPPNAWKGSGSANNWSCNAPNHWGCGYIYGFRVPFLVVSEFTGKSSGSGNYGGYISGACGASGQPTCPNNNFPYVHDFGSILAFTEFNFSLTNIDQSGQNGYADKNALDVSSTNIPLSDFFPLYSGSSSGGRPFVPIVGNNYPASFFQTYYTTHSGSPAGPDND